MSPKSSMAVSLLVALACAGCSSNSAKNTVTSASPPSLTAIKYYQPKVVYSFTGTYVLTKCKGDIPEVKAKVTMSPVISADAGTGREFDPASIPGRWRKQLDLKVELTDIATLKSVNAGVSDRTAAIITNVIKTIGSVFSMIAVAGEGPSACTDGVVTTLATIDAWEQEQKNVREARSAVREQMQQPKAGPQAPHGKAQPPRPTDKELIERLGALDARMKAAQESIASLRAELSIEHTAQIELTPDVQTYFFEVPTSAFEKWFKPASLQSVQKLAADRFEKLSVKPQQAFLASQFELGGVKAPDTMPLENKAEIVLRVPFETSYALCNGACTAAGAAAVKYHAQGTALIPQWGSIRAVDFAVAFAEERTVGFALDPAGRMSSMAYKRNARAEGISAAAAGISGETVNAIKSVRYAEEDAQLAEVKRELDYYDLRNKLKEAKDKYLQSMQPPATQGTE